MNIKNKNYFDDFQYCEDDEHHDEYEKYRIGTQEELDKYFLHSCTYTNLSHIKYLLTSAELKIHANVHAEDDLGFAHIIGNKEGGKEIAKYLIFDFNVDKTAIIEEMLNYDEKSVGAEVIEIVQEYKKMFEARELNKSLNNELGNNENNNKKLKI
jgi:hypothetical protein